VESWRRDEQAAEALIEWLAAREDGRRPYFTFLLLDSPHQTYSHPPGATPFLPSAPDLDYMAMTRNGGPPPELLDAVRNRYRNAVHHADDVLGRVLERLDASARRSETLVVVTGDHGEEFRECGFFGHTSAFTPPQLAVPFLMRGPGVANGIETRPTSHLDFAPTLLELLGADPAARASWTLGGHLLEPDPDAPRVLAGWNELGIWTPEAILRVPLSRLEFDVEVYDYDWNAVPDNFDVLQREHDVLEAVGEECNRFLTKG
jgi:membrane-anchored protein YejM (alkaline phosphatase superfamily)